MTSSKSSQEAKSADILPLPGANNRPPQQQTEKKRRKNLWGYYIDATPEEKAQRWQSTNPATKQAPRDLSSYTAYEKYLLDETPAVNNVEDADVEEAKNTMNREVLKAETDSTKAAREAREEQAKIMHEEEARQAKREDVSDDGAVNVGCVGGESENRDLYEEPGKEVETDMGAFGEDIKSIREFLRVNTVSHRAYGGDLGR
jgi:hypothetical protein